MCTNDYVDVQRMGSSVAKRVVKAIVHGEQYSMEVIKRYHRDLTAEDYLKLKQSAHLRPDRINVSTLANVPSTHVRETNCRDHATFNVHVSH